MSSGDSGRVPGIVGGSRIPEIVGGFRGLGDSGRVPESRGYSVDPAVTGLVGGPRGRQIMQNNYAFSGFIYTALLAGLISTPVLN